MRESKQVKPRQCRRCLSTLSTTAKGLKEHVETCGKLVTSQYIYRPTVEETARINAEKS